MDRKKSAIQIRTPRRREKASFLTDIPALACISFGMAGLLGAAFPSLPFPWWAAGTELFALSVLLSALSCTRLGSLSQAAACVLLLLIGAVLLKGLRGGLCVLINDYLAWLPEKTGHITLPFASDAGKAGVASVWGLALLAVLLSSGPALLLIPAFGVLLGTAAGFFAPDWGAAVFLLGVLQRLFTVNTPKRSRTVLVSLFLCALLAAGLAAGLDADPAARRERTSKELHALRFDEPTNSMPEGQLRNLGAWTPDDTPALAVTVSVPQKLYLRGFVGERYTGSAWVPLETKTIASRSDVFFLLHESGFYAQSAVGSTVQLTGVGKSAEMTIRNLSACSARAFLPYALCDTLPLDATLIGDASAPGAESMTFLYCPGSVPDWFNAQSALSVSQRGGAEQSYLLHEEQYRAFAEENYRAIPAETAELMQRVLPAGNTALTLSQVKDTVLTALETLLRYDAGAVTRDGSLDFLTYTLERSGTGYSVHYATAAAMMLRWLGVPARYAEGYFLSADEAAEYAADGEIVLTEKNAHAWAEYYLDGVGWIPFETTPGYMDDEELNAGPGTGLEGERFYQPPPMPETDVVQPDEIRERPGLRNLFRIPKTVYTVWLPLLLVLTVTAFLIWQRWRLNKALRTIRQSEPRRAIPALYGYAQYLLSHARGVTDDDEMAAALNREALFSAHPLTGADTERMENYTAATLAKCRAAWNLPQRFFYRVIRCLY